MNKKTRIGFISLLFFLGIGSSCLSGNYWASTEWNDGHYLGMASIL